MSNRRVGALTVTALVMTLTGLGASPSAASGSAATTRVSVSSIGTQGDGTSIVDSISADGRYIAFGSQSTNLVAGDDNNALDAFVHDQQDGTTSLVSVSSTGTPGNGISGAAAISADGRYVAFTSGATNLVPADTNGASDVFVRDLRLRTTTVVSVSSAGQQGNSDSDEPAISPDGRYVAFSSFANNLVPGRNPSLNLFVHDRQTRTTTLVSKSASGRVGNNFSYGATFSADNRYIAFTSFASNLVPDDTNAVQEAFVRDLRTGSITRVALSSTGRQANEGSDAAGISADGRYVAFGSGASNLVPTDHNGKADVFVRDLRAATTSLISISGEGAQANLDSEAAQISADGRYVAFVSFAPNLVQGDTNGFNDLFVRDRQNGTTRLVSLSSTGKQANENVNGATISADGRYAAFSSYASNMVPNDTNGVYDVFVRGLGSEAVPPPDGKYAILAGGNTVPGPGDSDGQGVAIVRTVLRDGAATGQVCANLSTSRLGLPTAAHIHAGKAEVAGPVVVDLTPVLHGGSPCIPGVPADIISRIRLHPGAFYVDIHTNEFPRGAVRGQLHG